jgi:hypothetical protein
MSDKPADSGAKGAKGDKSDQKKGPKKGPEGDNAENKKGDKQNQQKGQGKKPEDKSPTKVDAKPEEGKEEAKVEGSENKPEENKPKKQRKQKEKIIITLETVIPELPKKGERVQEPDENVFNAEIEKIHKEIEAIKTKMNDMIKTERNKLGKSGKESSAEQSDLKGLLKAKQAEIAKVNGDLTTLWDQMEQQKKGLEEYYDKSSKLRNRMKVILPRDKMVAELTALKNKQSQGSITMFEEKKVVRQIADLESSLPYAEPLQVLEDQFASNKDKKKSISTLIKKSKDQRDRFRAEEKDLKDALGKKKDANDKLYEEKEPAIEKIRDTYKGQIKDLKQKIRDLETKHNDTWNKFEAQQETIREIQWMRKVQDRLKRDQVRKQREEEDRKFREAEEAQNKETPYRVEMELCDLLVNYANKLLPQEATVEAEQPKDKSLVAQEALKSDAWKKEKVQLLVSKKDKEDDFFGINIKSKKSAQDKKPAQKDQGPQNLSLNHQMEILSYFDQIRVAPPLFTNKLQDTLKVLKEKKEYYKALSEKEEREGVDKKAETKEDKPEEGARKSPKKGQSQNKPLTEDDFPVMK